MKRKFFYQNTVVNLMKYDDRKTSDHEMNSISNEHTLIERKSKRYGSFCIISSIPQKTYN